MFENTLTESTRALLKKIGALPLAQEFYLAGGSAAALYLGHRLSVDLDFFTEKPEYDPENLQQMLASAGKLTVQQQSRGTLVGSINGVQVSFFVYPYTMLRKFENLYDARIASLQDISLMKIIAINQWGAMRDFIDLYFMCKQETALRELFDLVPKKYPSIEYPSYQILRSLVYFADADDDAPPRSLINWEWQAIKRFFEEQVKELMRIFE